jgi:hypothetical protein
MDNNMDGTGNDDDTESPDTRHDCEACACRDSACPCLFCCFDAVNKLTAENLIMGHTSSHGTWESRTRRTSSLHIGRRRFSATQDDRDHLGAIPLPRQPLRANDKCPPAAQMRLLGSSAILPSLSRPPSLAPLRLLFTTCLHTPGFSVCLMAPAVFCVCQSSA